jgi:hypothetical protein
VAGYRKTLDALAEDGVGPAPGSPVRDILGSAFTRGHFARAV